MSDIEPTGTQIDIVFDGTAGKYSYKVDGMKPDQVKQLIIEGVHQSDWLWIGEHGFHAPSMCSWTVIPILPKRTGIAG